MHLEVPRIISWTNWKVNKMGVLKFVKRLIVYGTLGALISLPVGYKIGYQRGSLNTAIRMQQSQLEEIAEDQYLVENPDNHRKYVVDFDDRTVQPYRSSEIEKKELEDIFAEGDE